MPIGNTGSGGSGSLTLLSSTTLSAPGTFDVASIAQTYSDLLLVFIVRGTRASAADGLLVRFNNDSTAANYASQHVSGNLAAASASNNAFGAVAGIVASNLIPGNTATANRFGVTECWVHGYCDAAALWHKNLMSVDWADYTGDTGREVDANGGVWLNTAAINRIQAQGQVTANLATGSQMRIYGRS